MESKLSESLGNEEAVVDIISSDKGPNASQNCSVACVLRPIRRSTRRLVFYGLRSYPTLVAFKPILSSRNRV